MRLANRLSVLTALVVLAAPATGLSDPQSGSTGAPVTQPPPKPQDPNKKICRKDPDTGSHISSHTCHTRAEWDAMADQTAEQYRNLRQRSDNGGGGPGPIGR